MARAGLPDWLIYGVALAGLVFAFVGGADRADPPPPVEPEGRLIGPASPFDPSVYVEVPDAPQPGLGTAFAVDPRGVWLTARHVVDGCAQAAVVVGRAQGVPAQIAIDSRADIAILRTEGAPDPLPSALESPLHEGQRAYHLGFPQGRPGEATSRLLGRETLVVLGRGARSEPVLAWAEAGRTEGLNGSLGGLSGSPTLNAQGALLGVTIAESPRRGRIYTTAPDTLRRALAAAGARPPTDPGDGALSPANYGRIADELRSDLQIARVVCLSV